MTTKGQRRRPGSRRAVRELLEALPAAVPGQRLDQRLDPLSELILTILSQHTSDRNSFPAFLRLRERFPTWEAVEAADPTAIADAIRSAGLANIKADRILGVLHEIRHRRGGLELAFLNDLPARDAARWLGELPGVGPKTAACVLLFSLGKGAMPVDTHIHRVLCRYGAVAERTSAADAQSFVESVLQATEMYRFHVAVIEHGRRICHARSPECGRCVLRPRCRFARSRPGALPTRTGFATLPISRASEQS